jgi:ABC-type nitrate/sulfonate/bicarbonate transport system permease component
MARSSEPTAMRKPLRLSDSAVGALSVVVLLALWEGFSRLGLVNTYSLPRPSKLAQTLWELAVDGFPTGITVWTHVWATVWRILKGYALASVTAVPLGLLIGSSRLLERAAGPVITFARAVATISLLPLAVAWFGVGELARVMLIFYGCFWIILTNVISGVRSVDVSYIRAGLMLGCNRRQMFRRVVLPATLPWVFVGMSVALGVAFMVIVAVEMVGTVKGLGALIMQGRTYYRSDAAIVGMMFLALFGFILSRVLAWLQRVLLPWAQRLEEVVR